MQGLNTTALFESDALLKMLATKAGGENNTIFTIGILVLVALKVMKKYQGRSECCRRVETPTSAAEPIDERSTPEWRRGYGGRMPRMFSSFRTGPRYEPEVKREVVAVVGASDLDDDVKDPEPLQRPRLTRSRAYMP